MYILVAFVGFEQGWYTLKFALGVAYRLRRKPIAWNTTLALLVILTAGLSAVIYAVTMQAPTLVGPYALLSATLIGSSFAGGLGCFGWLLYRATIAARSRVD